MIIRILFVYYSYCKLDEVDILFYTALYCSILDSVSHNEVIIAIGMSHSMGPVYMMNINKGRLMFAVRALSFFESSRVESLISTMVCLLFVTQMGSVYVISTVGRLSLPSYFVCTVDA